MKNPFFKTKGKTISEFAKEFLNIQPAVESETAEQQEVSKTNESLDEKLAQLQEKVESLEIENAALKNAMSLISAPDTNSIAKIRAAAQGFVEATAEGSIT